MADPPIYVTQSSLRPFEEFIPYLEKIRENRRLTNNGLLRNALSNAISPQSAS